MTVGASLDASFTDLQKQLAAEREARAGLVTQLLAERAERVKLSALLDEVDGRLDALEAEPTEPVNPDTKISLPVPNGFTLAYRNTFASAEEIADVTAFESGPAVNGALTPGDTGNSDLQKPSLKANVTKEPDAEATDGYALFVWSRLGTYALPNGATAQGWTNGRCKIGPTTPGPIFIRQRGRWLKPSVNIKTAVMWWPGNGQWPWEKDYPETFGGLLGSPWGDKSQVGIRMHKDQASDADLSAQEQLVKDVQVDGTEYHVYDMLIDHTQPLMVCWIDGVEVFRTTDPKWIAGTGTVSNDTVNGFFSVGKALTNRRDALHSEDAYIVDYLEFYRP
jgi:hypothetical protein